MKQILQSLKDGSIELVSSPQAQCSDGHLIVQTRATLISSGTERMLLDFGRASYLAKAKQQPEKVKKVLEKIKTDGIKATTEAIFSKLNQPLALGYCNVGTVKKIGKGVSGFKIGDRVISNAPHAQLVRVAKNLCVPVPDTVDDETAVFTVLASIGLQGVRLANPSLGENFAVIGVGLIGLLVVQLLKANGCRVLALDLDPLKLELARQFGADIVNLTANTDPIAAAIAFSRGHGVDGVIIAAATKSSEPIAQAAQMSRKRGRIILVGTAGLILNRADFYEKEISFKVSCSYGPGRYENAYEEKGLDYPIGFVRWTEQRNFEAILDLFSLGYLNPKLLISHRYAFEEAILAYSTLVEQQSALGIVLHYPIDPSEEQVNSSLDDTAVALNPAYNFIPGFIPGQANLGFIGAGNYASRILIPAFRKTKRPLHTIVSKGGLSAFIQGRKAGFIKAASDVDVILKNKDINTVVIATAHNSHADLVIAALNAGKHVFVEKPLALNLEELSEIEAAYHLAHLAEKKIHLMVGFNRRFAPQIQTMKQLLTTIKQPKVFILTMNAGALPANHWTLDPFLGGGRIVGEACHYIDLMRFLADCEITTLHVHRIHGTSEIIKEDKTSITLGFVDGSYGTIHYLANGSPAFPKERIEVFTAGKVLQLDNFRKLKGFGWAGFKKMNLWAQNKGQLACCQRFIAAIEQGLPTPIPFKEIIEVARIAIEAQQHSVGTNINSVDTNINTVTQN